MKETTPRPVLNVPGTDTNPYQRLLYQPPYEPVMLPKRAVRQIRRHAASHGSRLLHLHWDDRIFGRSKDPAANTAHMDETLNEIGAFKAEGGRLLWTIHNRQPHKRGDEACFHAARHEMCALADAIHVHAPHAQDHMVEEYGAPIERIHVVPHPSYLGVYEPAQTTQARECAVGERRRFLFFGAFRAAKGLQAIVDAAARLERRGYQFELLMRGRSFRRQEKFLNQLRTIDGVDVDGARFPDSEVPALFSESEVFLAPYLDMFSSGSVMLAQTFGQPVVAPDTRPFRESVAAANHRFLYDPSHPRGLLRKMAEVIQMPLEDLIEHRAAARRFAEDTSPGQIATGFCRLLDQLSD
ncbi:MAG: glycosyltransferase family 4 protein [Pseudomonadota bacterium]